MAKMESTGSIINDDGERMFVVIGLSADEYAEEIQGLNEVSLSRSSLEILRSPTDSNAIAAFGMPPEDFAHPLHQPGASNTTSRVVARSLGAAILNLEPAAPPPTPCHGCSNYYGEIHGGTQLVCAMHPMGPESDNCKDREEFRS